MKKKTEAAKARAEFAATILMREAAAEAAAAFTRAEQNITQLQL